MATVTTRSFSQFVQTFVAAAQAGAVVLLDFSVGSVGRAYAEAASAFALWFQYQCLILLARTRAQTSTGTDLDSWMGQFPLEADGSAFSRLDATPSNGFVLLSRANGAQAAVIPVGSPGTAQFETSDTTVGFIVVKDTTVTYWNPAQNAYVIPINTLTALIPAEAATAGNVTNTGIGLITRILDGNITNIDTVSNPAAFTGGFDGESDAAFRSRFQLALAALASADLFAVESAIANVQQGLKYNLLENVDYPALNTDNGSFAVVLDDGSHAPPASLLTAVYNAIYRIRGFPVRVQGVYAPTPVSLNISGSISTAAGFDHGQVVESVDAAWSGYINALSLGVSAVTVAALIAVALAVPGCTNVSLTSVRINGVNADFPISAIQVPIVGTISAA